MLPKAVQRWYLLVLLAGSLCISIAGKINVRSAIRDKQDEIRNIVDNISESLSETECTLDEPMIFGLESMDESRDACQNDNGDPMECLNDIIFFVKNMPHFENFYCNLTEECGSKANETLQSLWIFREDFSDEIGSCNESISQSEENPLNISCSECQANDLFWQGLITWTDNLELMLDGLENDEFATLQSKCNKEHARKRKAAAKKQQEDKARQVKEEKARKAEERKRKKQERKRRQAEKRRKQKERARKQQQLQRERERQQKNQKGKENQ